MHQFKQVISVKLKSGKLNVQIGKGREKLGGRMSAWALFGLVLAGGYSIAFAEGWVYLRRVARVEHHFHSEGVGTRGRSAGWWIPSPDNSC